MCVYMSEQRKIFDRQHSKFLTSTGHYIDLIDDIKILAYNKTDFCGD